MKLRLEFDSLLTQDDAKILSQLRKLGTVTHSASSSCALEVSITVPNDKCVTTIRKIKGFKKLYK